MVEFPSTVSGGPKQSQLQVHVPEEVARHLGLNKGDTFVWDVQNDKVTVRKKEAK